MIENFAKIVLALSHYTITVQIIPPKNVKKQPVDTSIPRSTILAETGTIAGGTLDEKFTT
jgi:precorrin-6x reductase